MMLPHENQAELLHDELRRHRRQAQMQTGVTQNILGGMGGSAISGAWGSMLGGNGGMYQWQQQSQLLQNQRAWGSTGMVLPLNNPSALPQVMGGCILLPVPTSVPCDLACSCCGVALVADEKECRSCGEAITNPIRLKKYSPSSRKMFSWVLGLAASLRRLLRLPTF